MNEDRETRNEIIADDLADEGSKRSTSNIRSRINREVVRIDDKPSPFIDDDEEISEEPNNEEVDEGNEEHSTQKREKSLVDHIITGSLLTDGTIPYHRYFIVIAVMCFISIVLTFLSLNAGNEYRRKEALVTALHEHSVVMDEERYELSSKRAVTERLKEYNIELVDLSKSSRLIEK